MKSEFCQWLNDMQEIADNDNIVVQARHFDVLDYYFKAHNSPQEAFADYKNNFLPRWNAINQSINHEQYNNKEN